MKIGKYLMVAAASVMMFGCAKDDNNGPKFNGPAAVSINVVDLVSKATPSTGQSIEIVPDEKGYEVKLNATSGEKVNEWVTIPADQLNGEYIFWNVEGQTSVEVRVNGGKPNYTSLDGLANLTPANMAVYGKTETFTRTDVIEGEGANAGKQYDLYTATVEAKIPVARVEISGITHVDEAEKECDYKTLTLNNIEFVGVHNAANYPYTTATGNVTLAAATDEALLEYNFLAEGEGAGGYDVYPTDGSCHAFNMFQTQMGENTLLRFDFEGESKDGAIIAGSDRYAVVKTINGEENFTFEAGKVYTITDVQIADGDITSDPTGNTSVAVNVIVTVQKWTVVPTTVDF